MRLYINIFFVLFFLVLFFFAISYKKSEKKVLYENHTIGKFSVKLEKNTERFLPSIIQACKYWSKIIATNITIQIIFSSYEKEGDTIAESTIISSNERNLTTKGRISLNTKKFVKLEEKDKITTIKHEICHILGFGNKWKVKYDEINGPHLDRNDYPLTHDAYASLMGYDPTQDSFILGIPIEESGGKGVATVHWENNDRDFNSKITKGITNDLMVCSIKSDPILSILTLNNLKDLGWEINTEYAEDIDFSLPRSLFNSKYH